MGACSCVKLKKAERFKITVASCQGVAERKSISNRIELVNYLVVNDAKQVPILNHPANSLLLSNRSKNKIQPEANIE